MRYLKVTFLLGFVVCLLLAAIYEAGHFQPLDRALASALAYPIVPLQNKWAHYAVAAFLAFGVAWTTIDIPRLSLKVVVAFGALAQVISAAWIVHRLGTFFSPFPALLAILASFLGALAYARSEPGRRKRLLEQLFGERVSTKSFHALLDAPTPLNLEGERRELTIVVCEIFNHDQLEETLPAPDYVALTNSFRSNASDFLVGRGGYLDECDGESLRVIFGAPLADRRHALTACEAALALAERLDEVNRECHTIWKQMFDFRIGVNSGEIVVAAYGSRRLGTFSVAGEPVEFARRLCRANLIYGSRALIGSMTFQLAESGIEVRPLELIQRSEKGVREEIYELLARHDVLPFEELERRDLFWKGVVFYRERRWDEALTLFETARAPTGADASVEFYIRRIEQLRAGLPSLDWSTARL